MKTVYFKNKNANHAVNILGKHVRFIDGKAEIEDKEAEKLAKKEEYSLKPFVDPKKKKAGRKRKSKK